MKHTISALVENKFGVLARVAGMFSGRGFNIETLNVGPMQDGKYSRITATVKDDKNLEQCVKQLSKLVNVVDVKDFSKLSSFVARELVLVRIKSSSKTRSELIEIAGLFRAKIVDVDKSSLIVECTGNPAKVQAFLNILEPFGILEMARSGNLALERGKIYQKNND